MATEEQRARRRAQRETAARVKAGRTAGIVPRGVRQSIRASREAYARDVIAGREQYPPVRSPEGNNLASLASKARWGKADPIFEKKFSKYWYHKDDEKDNDADIEDAADTDGNDDDADNETTD